MKSFNVRNLVLVLLIVMLVSFALAGMTGGISLNFDNWSGVGPSETIDIDKVFAADDLVEITAGTVSTDVNIIPVDSAEVKVHLHGTVSQHAMPELVTDQRSGRLTVKVEPKRNVIGTTIYRLKLDIYVPENYTGSIRVDTVSGSLNITDFNLKSLTFHSVSGRVRADSMTAGETIFKTTSGNAEISGIPGNMEFRSVSGNLDAKYSEFANNISINTTSGKVKLTLPQGSEFYLKAETVSGKITTDFPVTVTSQQRNSLEGVAGSDLNRITAKTVSGNITLSK
jgi:lia operon protein LiaG